MSHWSLFRHLAVCCLHVICKFSCPVWSVVTNSSWKTCHWSFHDPTLASRFDPFLCFCSIYFLCSSHPAKASILTVLRRPPWTRLPSTSLPNPVVRFVSSGSPQPFSNINLLTQLMDFLLLFFMTSLIIYDLVACFSSTSPVDSSSSDPDLNVLVTKDSASRATTPLAVMSCTFPEAAANGIFSAIVLLDQPHILSCAV